MALSPTRVVCGVYFVCFPVPGKPLAREFVPLVELRRAVEALKPMNDFDTRWVPRGQ